MGGEDIDFYNANPSFGFAWNTSAYRFRADWCRGTIGITSLTGGGSFPDAPGSIQRLAVSFVFPVVSDFWFHAQLWMGDATTDNNYNQLGFGKNNVWRLALQGTGVSGQRKLQKRNSVGGVTLLDTSASGVFTAGLHQLDVHVVYGASGSVDVYLDKGNTPVLSFVGDVTTDAEIELNQFFMGTHWSASSSDWSETFVADFDTRRRGLFTKPPQAPGNTQDWYGTVAAIDEGAVDDGDAIVGQNNGDISEWTTPPLPAGGPWNVDAVVQRVRASVTATGPQNFDFVVRPATGSTDFFSADVAGTTTLENYGTIWQVNPATGLAFRAGDLGTGFNLGVRAVA